VPGRGEDVMAFGNVGSADRVIRIVLGLGLLSLVFAGPQTLWGLAGLIFIVTGLAGTCPIYSMLGWSTRGQSSRTAH
jgi:hypothetical protein